MKKMKRAILMTIITAFAMMLFACGEKEEELTVKTYIPNESNVKIIGRAASLNDTLWMVHSGSGAEFTFLGTTASITLQGDSSILGTTDSRAHFAIYVNGECVVDELMEGLEKTYTVFEKETEEQCTIKIVKLSEAAQSTMGIKSIEVTSKGDITPTENKEKFIEFIGDSITCGYGVEDEVKEHPFRTSTENAMKAYAYKTAEALEADYSLVSFSGHGIISGYTATGNKVPEQTVPQYYEKLGFSYGAYMGEKPVDYEWDFQKRQPDVIVVNLGTNDDTYTLTHADRQQEYTDTYVEFLKTIRENNPDATIVCTLGIMGDRLFSSVTKAVETYKSETSDANVYTMKFDVQSPADGYAADWHPTEATHTKAAEKLTKELKEIMGW
ncbi:MAG: GDSL family lipase [Lachnospiraceae bacterium]|nr:GDSL family lipase [Lachnospiraceae bacterium]